MKLNEIIPSEPEVKPDRAQILRNKVIQTYFVDGKVPRLPTQNKKRWIVYLEIIKLFSADRSYTEREINELIQNIHEDYCMVRRELVEEGVLIRQDGVYQFVPDFQRNPGFYQKIWQMSEGATTGTTL